MGLAEGSDSIKMTGTVSNDCHPLAIGLRNALLGMKDAFAGYANNEHQQHAMAEANRMIRNSEGLK